MKPIHLAAALIACLAAPSPALAVGGCTSSGCGGNFSATEFKDLATDIFASLQRMSDSEPIRIKVDRVDGERPVAKKIEINPEELRAAFKSVSVVNDELYLDGKPVSFKSNPDARHVDFSEKDWKDHPYRISRLRMVVHELLMLASRKNPELDDYLYDEQLSRGIARLIAEDEIRHPKKRRVEPTQYCLMLYHRPNKLDPLIGKGRVFGEKGNDVEVTRQLVIQDCHDAWPQEYDQCEKTEIRCGPQGDIRHFCTIRVGIYPIIPVKADYSGYGNSAIEAEYEARRDCLKQAPWNRCISQDPGVAKLTCTQPDRPPPPAEEPAAGELPGQHPAF